MEHILDKSALVQHLDQVLTSQVPSSQQNQHVNVGHTGHHIVTICPLADTN